MIISDTAIKNRTTVFVLVALIVVAGVMSYITLPRESAPEVKIPIVLITTPHRGADPSVVEETVTNKIEQELTGLKGMKEIRSVSAEGISTIIVEFQPEIDIDDALQRVKDKVDLAKPELPSNTDEPVEPVITEINVAEFPIMLVNMVSEISPVRMRVIAEDLQEELEAVPGVLEVDLRGVLEREIIIALDPDRLSQYGLTIPEILQLSPAENVNQSAGRLETEGTKFNIRVPAEFVQPDQIDTLPLANRNGKLIYLSDVAEVQDTFKDRTSYSRLDGVPSITLAVKKRVGANIIEVAAHVKAVLAEVERRFPFLSFQLISDRSDDIANMVADLENNIISGLVLVMLVLVAFMGLRSSIIVALAIPLSMLMSFAILQVMGITLNMVVLFSLILALGMLVDNAIVIVENIYRFMEMGFGRVEAAMKGTAEVAWPVIASTATTVAAFSPLLFWPGIMGDFMQYLPMTVITVLSCSLFVAMVVNPVICSVFAKPPVKKEKPDEKANWLMDGYRRLLDIVLHHPVTTLLVAFLFLATVGILYIKRGEGIELFPTTDPDQAQIDIRAPQGTNINETDRITRLIEQRLEPFRKTADGDLRIEHIVADVGAGGGGGGFGGGGGGGVHNALITLVFPEFEERVDADGTAWRSDDVIKAIRDQLGDIAGAEISINKDQPGPPTGAPVTVRLIGRDMDELQRLSERAMDLMETVPNLVNLRSDLEAAKPELIFIPDRKRANLLGVNTNVIGQFLKTAVFGTKVSDFREYNDEYDIRIRLPVENRSSITELLRLRVPSGVGQAIPISSLGRFEYRPGLGTINRVDRKRVVTITADAEGRLGTEVLQDVQERLAKKLEIPTGYAIEYAGEKEEQDEATAFLGKAFLLALLLIVGILVAQFNTLSAPLIIMVTVILSTIGVFIGLLVADLPFGVVMTGVGVISLAGVVVNNAIVLLDYTRQLQRRGRDILDAAIEAGCTRLRPVMLTATTTILGLIPMATGVSFNFHTFRWATRSDSSQWWAAMAIAVIFGLGFATLLTLLVVPSFYVLIYRLAARFGLGGLHKVDEELTAKPVLEDY
jgi:multidrug efflux pump subunit AcrB